MLAATGVNWCQLQDFVVHLTGLDRVHVMPQLKAGVLQNHIVALFGVSPSTISQLKAKFQIMEWSETGREASQEDNTSRRPFSHPVSTVRTVGSLLKICRQGLQDDTADGFLPRQSGTDCTQPISSITGLPGGLPWLPLTIRPICAGTRTYGWKLWSESRFCLWQLDHGVKCGKDAENTMPIASSIEYHLSWWCEGGILLPGKLALSSLEAVSIQKDIEVRFCNQWQSHYPTAVLTSTPLNTYDKCWMKNGMPSHSSVDQAGDLYEEEMPGCCGCVWFFHVPLRLLFVTLINC